VAGTCRCFLVALLALAGAATALGQDPGPAPPPAPAAAAEKPPPLAEDLQAQAQKNAESMSDGLTIFFVMACLAAGAIGMIIAFRVYARVRLDNPVIAAVNDPWVQAKLREQEARAAAGMAEPADPTDRANDLR
jgi:hypothetical protein